MQGPASGDQDMTPECRGCAAKDAEIARLKHEHERDLLRLRANMQNAVTYAHLCEADARELREKLTAISTVETTLPESA